MTTSHAPVRALMALMRDIEKPSACYNRAVRRAAQTLTDSPENDAAVRTWTAKHPDPEQPARRVLGETTTDTGAQADKLRRLADEALLDYLSRTADIRPGRSGELAFMPEITDPERLRLADAVLAVLPAPADRAAACPECGDTGACNGGPCPLADRRARYAAAIRETDGWVLDDGQHMIAAVMAVADSEQAELRAQIANLRTMYDIADNRTCDLIEERDQLLTAPADRAAILREAADRYTTLADQNEAYDREHGELDEVARVQHGAVRDVAAGLRRMADEAQQPTTTEQEPVPLRWGLDDVMWGDDDTVTVMLSGPAGEPYWLELDPERAAVLRDHLAGPDGEAQQPAPAVTEETTPHPPSTAALLADPCDACQHTLNWHRNDIGCTVPRCVCGQFHATEEPTL